MRQCAYFPKWNCPETCIRNHDDGHFCEDKEKVTKISTTGTFDPRKGKWSDSPLYTCQVCSKGEFEECHEAAFLTPSKNEK